MIIQEKELLIKAGITSYLSLNNKIGPNIFQNSLYGLLDEYYYGSKESYNTVAQVVNDLENDIYMKELPAGSKAYVDKAEKIIQFIKSKLVFENSSETLDEFFKVISLKITREEGAKWAQEKLLDGQELSSKYKDYLLKFVCIDLLDDKTKNYIYTDQDIFEWFVELI